MNIDPRDKYITLKKAGEISGYAPDYLGQLIRKGKLQGKQIYYNVAWVTTEEAIREFMKKNNVPGAEVGWRTKAGERLKAWWAAHSSTSYLIKVARRAIYFVIGALFIFSAILIYAFFANVARWASGHP